MERPTFLNIKADLDNNEVSVVVESDGSEAGALLLVAIFLDSVKARLDMDKDEILESLSSTMDKMTTTHHVDISDMH